MGFVAVDFLGGAVFLGIRIGHRVSVVTVGIDLENGREGLLMSAAHGARCLRPYFVEVLAVGDVPHDSVSVCPFSEAISHR